jgi:hypothetical protein
VTVRIVEVLPPDPVEAEAVLHVRKALRRRIRVGADAEKAAALAILFGKAEAEAGLFSRAAATDRPVSAAAAIVADGHGVAVLGHDSAHVEACRQFLMVEKDEEPNYDRILAFDLGTLLALSRARMLARAGVEQGRPVPIVIRGDTGTGKELLAEAIHNMSGRKGKLVPVHVAGMPQDEISDAIFGHVKGAYTGAVSNRNGLLSAAHRGTFQLDEVGDLPADAQVRLLRVLQNGVFSRLGETETQEVDVRIIASTWHNLVADIGKGTFRQDLYHRICAGEVVLPPLRSRNVGFESVVSGLLNRIGYSGVLARSAADALGVYAWPGNLRELENTLRVAVASAEGDPIRLEDLPPAVQKNYLEQPLEVRGPGVLCDDPDGIPLDDESVAFRLEALEAMIESDTPEVDLASSLSGFLSAMDGLPDASGGHETLMQDFRANVALASHGAREQLIGDRLASVASAPALPAAVREAARAAAQRHASIGDANLEAARRKGEQLDPRQSPWGRLFVELSEHPLLRNEDHSKILGFVSVAVKIAHTFDAGFVDRVRQTLTAGGLRAVIDGARQAALANNTTVGDEEHFVAELPVRPPGHHRGWTREQWVELVLRCETLKGLEGTLGISGKTVKQELKRHGVAAPWMRARQP